MKLNDLIEALESLRAKHGGDIRVTRLGVNAQVSSVYTPQIAWIKENQGRESRVVYWNPCHEKEGPRQRAKGEMVIRV